MTEDIQTSTPECKDLNLGFIPLIDCCVLAVAKEQGFFSKYGLNVTLHKEASWANIRDKVCVGALDGAHMLAGIPIATTLGLGFTKKPMVTAFSMNLNSNAITVSASLFENLLAIDPDIAKEPKRSGAALKKYIEQRNKKGEGLLTFAMVYPFSNHNYEIRYWMAAAGIDPDKDVVLKVIPPQFMVANLKENHIDGFCVGEPWNSYAIKEGVGNILITGYDIWNNSPEKVFAVTRDWSEKYPKTHIAIIKALLEATRWIDEADNHEKLIDMLASDEYIGIDKNIISQSISGSYEYQLNGEHKSVPDFHVFNNYQANFPWCSHACWIITQMCRWGQIDQGVDVKEIAESVYQANIYRQAASELGMTFPSVNYKTEGEHNSNWELSDADINFLMGSDAFVDGKTFDANHLIDYLTSFDIKHIKIEIEDLKTK